MHKPPSRDSRKSLTRVGGAFLLAGVLGVSAFLVIHTNDILDLLASSLSSFSGATTTVFFTPYGDETLQPGDSATIDVNVNTKVPINALGATISYPKDSLDIVSISKEKSFFDLWTEDTTIAEDSGEIRFSGGTTKQGGIIGTGTVLTLIVRAKIPGSAQLLFKNLQVFPNNGTGKAIDTQTRTFTYTIEKPEVLTSSGGGTSPAPVAQQPLPNPDLNGDGKVNLIDLSILTFKMLTGYNARYDLNANGSVGLDDLSILLSKI